MVLTAFGFFQAPDDLPASSPQRLLVDPGDELVYHLIPHPWRRSRPRPADQVLHLAWELAQLPFEALHPAALQRAHHLQVGRPIVPSESLGVQPPPNPSQGLGAHGEHLQQVTDTFRQPVPRDTGRQTVRWYRL